MHPLARRLLATTFAVAVAAAACRCGGAVPAPPGASSLVTFVTTELPPPSTGLPYSAAIVARGPHPPLTWRVAGGALPPGLGLDPETGAVEGWPRRAGRFVATVEVRDGNDPALANDVSVAAARRAFSFEVARGPLTVLPGDVPPLGWAAPVSHRFEAAGGAEPYVFAAAGASLPDGLALAPDGRLGGSPRGQGGVTEIVVAATDAAGARAERTFSIRVVLPPIAVATTEVPPAAEGFPYSAELRAWPMGVGPPLSWSLATGSGPLPPGLSLGGGSGVVEGEAVAAGDFPVRVEVRDAAGQVAARDVVFHVNPGPVLLAVEPYSLERPGDPVTLVGQAFQPGMTVAFGVAAAVEATWVDATRASAVPPMAPLQTAAVDVSVRNPDGGLHVRPNAFRYPLGTVEFAAAGVKGTARDRSRGIAAGDLDGDGLCDLVHVGAQGMELIRPVGPSWTGVWQTVLVRSDGSFNDVRLADVDADGDLDVVASRSSTTETIETYANDGQGHFPATPSRTTTYPKPSNHFPHSLAVGDVDGDGVPDVAFTSCRGNQGVVWVYRGLGDGSFVPLHEAMGTVHDAVNGCFAPNGIVLADLDGDGRDDLVVADAFPACCAPGYSCSTTGGVASPFPGAREIVAWTARSGPDGIPLAWTAARVSPAGAVLDGDNEGLAAYDHDGDGRLDVAVFGGFQDLRGKGIAFLAGDGTGALSERHVRATDYDRRFGARIDANLDKCDDLIVVGGDGTAESGTGAGFSVAECWLGGTSAVPVRAWASGSEGQSGGSVPGANPGRVAVGDFDGDGLLDFAVDQTFAVKERFANDQADGSPEGIAIYLNRSH